MSMPARSIAGPQPRSRRPGPARAAAARFATARAHARAAPGSPVRPGRSASPVADSCRRPRWVGDGLRSRNWYHVAMAQRHTVEMLLLHDDSPRDLEARRQLAAALPGAEVTEPSDVGAFDVVLDADDQEHALQRVWD